MIKNYIRHFYKDMIWTYLGIIGTIYFVLYSCYNMPTFASYHNYGFTYFFVVTMLCIIIFGTRYQYKEFKKSCIECQKAIQAKKEQYKNFTLDTLVDLIYDNDAISLNLLGCPEGFTEEQEKQFLKDYIIKLKDGDKMSKLNLTKDNRFNGMDREDFKQMLISMGFEVKDCDGHDDLMKKLANEDGQCNVKPPKITLQEKWVFIKKKFKRVFKA